MRKISLAGRWIPHDVAGQSKGISYDYLGDDLTDNGPVTVAFWLYWKDNASSNQHIFYADQLTNNTDDAGVRIYKDTAPGEWLEFDIKTDGALFAFYNTNETLETTFGTDGGWQHICGRWNGIVNGGDAPDLFINGVQHTGGNSTDGDGNRTATGGSHTFGGRESTQARGANASLAGAGRWQAFLSDAEIRALAQGTHPLDIRRESLILCPDLGGDLSNLAARSSKSKQATFVEHGGITGGPPKLKQPKMAQPKIALADVPTDTRVLSVPKIISWTKQPPAGTPIDWSNPLTKGLVSAFNFQPGPIVDLVTGKRLDVYTHTTGTAAPNDVGATIDAPIYKTCRGGMGIDMQPRSGPTYTWLRNTTGIFDLTDFPEYSRLIGIADFDSSGSGNPGLWRSADNSLGNDFDIYGAADDGWWLYVNGLTKHQSNNTDVIALGPYENHSISYGSDGDTHAYIDGQLKASDVNVYTAFTTNTVYNLGCQHVVNKYLGGTWTHLYIWNKELTEGEHKALGENPWQIFKPRKVMVPIDEALPDLGTFELPAEDMPK